MKYYLLVDGGSVARYRESKEGGLEHFVPGDNWSPSRYANIDELRAEAGHANLCGQGVVLVREVTP